MANIRKNFDKETRKCMTCGQIKTDYFIGSYCQPCDRIKSLIKLHLKNFDKLEDSIKHDEEILAIKRSILAGIHPVTKEKLRELRRYCVVVIQDNKEVFFAEIDAYFRAEALMKVPNIVPESIEKMSNKGMDIDGKIYKIKGNGTKI